MIAAGALFTSCRDQRYETISPDRIVGAWGVTDDTHAFGQYDSLFYIISPVRNINDSIYYNGNYTDSYYEADSTRVTLRYATSDSIEFYIDRMYAVEVNPKFMLLTATVEGPDDVHKTKKDRDDKKTEKEAEEVKEIRHCTLLLKRDNSNGNIFRSGPNEEFAAMLALENVIRFTGTNANSQGVVQGGQNYEFLIDAYGFHRAILMADSLNALHKPEAHKAVHGAVHHNIIDEIFNPHPSKPNDAEEHKKDAEEHKTIEDTNHRKGSDNNRTK